MIHPSLVRPALAILTAAAMLLGAAASPGFAATEKTKKPTADKAKRGNNAKFIPGSQETARERSSRLKRECKGRVNAGVCEGYTQ